MSKTHCLYPRTAFLPPEAESDRRAGENRRVIWDIRDVPGASMKRRHSLTAEGVYEDRQERGDLYKPISFPCNQCINCRIRRAADLKVRMALEMWMHEQAGRPSCFVTLTYDDVNLPVDAGLDRGVIAEFVNKLRVYLRRAGVHVRIRYGGCGEYGENGTRRPHFHLILYGWMPDDMQPWRKTSRGEMSYRSEFLERVWTSGYVEVAPGSIATCGYVSGYLVKKLSGKLHDGAFYRPHPLTGEFFQVAKPFFVASRPGLGSSYCDEWSRDFLHDGMIVFDGKPTRVPDAFLKRLAKSDAEAVLALKASKEIRAIEPVNYERALREAAPHRVATLEEISYRKVNGRARDLGDA